MLGETSIGARRTKEPTNLADARGPLPRRQLLFAAATTRSPAGVRIPRNLPPPQRRCCTGWGRREGRGASNQSWHACTHARAACQPLEPPRPDAFVLPAGRGQSTPRARAMRPEHRRLVVGWPPRLRPPRLREYTPCHLPSQPCRCACRRTAAEPFGSPACRQRGRPDPLPHATASRDHPRGQ